MDNCLRVAPGTNNGVNIAANRPSGNHLYIHSLHAASRAGGRQRVEFDFLGRIPSSVSVA